MHVKWLGSEEQKALCELKLHTETGKEFQQNTIFTKKKSICTNWRRFSHEHFRMRSNDARIKYTISIKGSCSTVMNQVIQK